MWTPLPPEVLSRLIAPTSDGTCSESRPSGDWQATFTEIEGYRTLTYDYDGQRAVPPSPAVFDAVSELAEGLRLAGVAPPAYVVPGGDGSLNLEWDLAGDVLLTIDVDDPARAEVFVVTQGAERAESWVLDRLGSNGTAGTAKATSGSVE